MSVFVCKLSCTEAIGQRSHDALKPGTGSERPQGRPEGVTG